MEKEVLAVTLTQKKLLELLRPIELTKYIASLKTIHYLATYGVPSTMVELAASKDVADLIAVLEEVVRNRTFCND
jgi:hypothetical protein